MVMTSKCEGFFIDRQKIVFAHRLYLRKMSFIEMRITFMSWRGLCITHREAVWLRVWLGITT